MSCDNFKPINEPTGSNGGGGSTAWEDITHKPTAFPSLWSLIGEKPNFFSGSFNDLSDLPTFFSGSWNDLSDRPMAYPPAGHDHTVSDITDFPPLFSGSWNDLSNKPNIFSVLTDTGDGSQFLANNGTYKSIGGETVNIETLTANKTLTASDATVQILSSSANRDINLPTTGLQDGHKYKFLHDAGGGRISIKQGTTVLYVLNARNICDLVWKNQNWIPFQKNAVAIGSGAKASSQMSIAIGDSASDSGGIAIGNSANNNLSNSDSICIGKSAYSSGYYNVVIGRNATSTGDGVVSIGDSANASDIGIAIGRNSVGNGATSIGMSANATVQGVAVGRNAIASGGGTSVGSYSSINSKGYFTVSFGYYAIAQRSNELVSTTGSSNKAQMTIQKYVEKDLNSNSSAFQELFIDGSSARLTIIASSVYQFRIQLNAIDNTNFDVKTWEITGAIKRNASNVTSLVGTPTKTVTAQDAGASEWDVQVTADDTNEALKIEVKHTSANQVRFSLNIWATETRI